MRLTVMGTNPQTEARAIAEDIITRFDLSDYLHPDKLEPVIATALAAKDAELAEANARAERQWAGWVKEEALRKAAEAQLAEANKALEEIADAKTELTDRHDYSRGWNDALFRVRQIARRAREAQGGE